MAAVSQNKPTGPMEDSSSQPRPANSKLEDQAATAALYVTRYDRQNKNGQEFLDKDHKLSSAGAAASLKYANAQDLPSYPSTGLKNGDSAAGAAASLGWANQKPFEHWIPDPSASASAAAAIAKDYKMAPLWQPEQSANGAKAAVLAHRDGGKVDIWQPETSEWGNSAATQAFKKFGAGSLSPVLDYGYTNLGRQGSLMAANGAMSQGRKRAQSIPNPVTKPETYPDEANAASNALSAATSAHKHKRNVPSEDGGAVPWTNMPREMYTSHPPVAPEVDEKNRRDTLHASAVAMAKGMYNRQQAQSAGTSLSQHGASAAHGRKPSSSSIESEEVQPMRFNSLQEAAQKLAQERLAKLHDEHAKNREYRDYYGQNDTKRDSSISQASYRLSLRGRARRRASSDGDIDEDREQSNKIRAQMSLFSSNLSQVDEKKRAQDREALIAVAQRNVTKSLNGMDQKLFAETGKASPALLSQWEVKAHAAAQANSDARMSNHGKVHIGGGKFLDRSEIDKVAQRNVQPVLDEINEKAEAERERQAALKLEQETIARKAAEKKSREKEAKAIDKKLKQQDKDEEKMRKADEKAARKEEERLAKERRKSIKSDGGVAATETITRTTETTEANSAVPEEELAAVSPVAIRTSMEDEASLRMQENADAANPDESTPMSPNTASNAKVKNWLKSKFSRRMSKSTKSSSTGEKEKKEEGFVGGAAFTGASANNSSASLGQTPSSVRDVALANTDKTTKSTTEHEREPSISDSISATPTPAAAEEEEEERIGRTSRRASTVSSLEQDNKLQKKETEDEEFQEARDNFDEDLAPPPTFPAEKSNSPVRDSKFKEVI